MLTPLNDSFNCFLFPMKKDSQYTTFFFQDMLWNELFVENDYKGPSDDYVLKSFILSPVDYLRKHLFVDKPFTEMMDEYVEAFKLNASETERLFHTVKANDVSEVVPCKLVPAFQLQTKANDLVWSMLHGSLVLQSRKCDLHRLKNMYFHPGDENNWCTSVSFSPVSINFMATADINSYSSDVTFSVDNYTDETEYPSSDCKIDCTTQVSSFDELTKCQNAFACVFIKQMWYAHLENSFYLDLYTHKNAVIISFSTSSIFRIERVDPHLLNKDLYNES